MEYEPTSEYSIGRGLGVPQTNDLQLFASTPETTMRITFWTIIFGLGIFAQASPSQLQGGELCRRISQIRRQIPKTCCTPKRCEASSTLSPASDCSPCINNQTPGGSIVIPSPSDSPSVSPVVPGSDQVASQATPQIPMETPPSIRIAGSQAASNGTNPPSVGPSTDANSKEAVGEVVNGKEPVTGNQAAAAAIEKPATKTNDDDSLKAKAEEERIAKEKAEAEASRLAKDEAERLTKEKAEIEAAARRKEEEEATAEAARMTQEKATADDPDKHKAEEEAKMEAERLAQEKAAAEAAAKLKAEEEAKREAERLAQEKAAAEDAAKLKAEEEARMEAERVAREKAAAEAAKQKEEAERIAKVEAEIKAAEEAKKLAYKNGAKVVLRSIQVTNKKKDGSSWDSGSDADVLVAIKTKVQKWTSTQTVNSNQADFKESFGPLKAGDTLDIVVMDQDLIVNDLIGSTLYTLTDADIDKGSIELTFGSVESIKFELSAP